MTLTRSRRILYRMITVAIGLIAAAAILEIGLRVVGYSLPTLYIADEKLGYSFIPGTSGNYRKEGKSYLQINSDGFNDEEHSVPKPEGVYRIAFVGDSFVEALQVGRDEHFAKFAAEKLVTCADLDGKKPEVLRFGVSGYGTAQELIMLREKVLKYSPDLVVLLVTTNNDITDNSRDFRQQPVPFFVLKNGRLEADNSFLEDKNFKFQNSPIGRLGTWFKNELRFVQGVGEASAVLKARYRLWKDGAKVSAPNESEGQFEPGIDVQVYREPTDENWINAWNITEALIDQMRSDVESSRARFVVVTGSNGVQVLPRRHDREAFAQKLGVVDLFYPDRRISEHCRTAGISVITLAPDLAEYSAINNVFLHGFEGNIGYGHWNQTGHRVVGDILGTRLCGLLGG